MKKLLVIIVFQEFMNANHKPLWNKIQNFIEHDILIIDIPSDQIITRFKKKRYRILESNKGIRSLSKRVNILRPKFLIRPEILPRIFNKISAKSLMRQIKKYYPEQSMKNIDILTYSRKWIDILSNFGLKLTFYYYIIDEYRYSSTDDSQNKKAVYLDEKACKKSKHIFVMSERIKELRPLYSNKITVIGNGAEYSDSKRETNIIFQNSVAFIGNFRNWIDISLLKKLINLKKDYIFGFVGPIEDNMVNDFNKILNSNSNVIYLGRAQRDEISKYYKMFNVIIVPYKSNRFMDATRPIKIVESVFSGVPVVTIPINGYEETDFIKFASTAKDFSHWIDYFKENGIDLNSKEYLEFVDLNSWSRKAQIIANIITED